MVELEVMKSKYKQCSSVCACSSDCAPLPLTLIGFTEKFIGKTKHVFSFVVLHVHTKSTFHQQYLRTEVRNHCLKLTFGQV